MHPILSLIEEKGLTCRELIESKLLHQWPIHEIENFSTELYQRVLSGEAALRENCSANHDPFRAFNFVASTGLSGISGCFELNCRVKRAQTLARYAALYAGRVIAPMEFVDPHKYQRPRDSMLESELRYHMTGTVLCIHEMGPAIEAGLIGIVMPELHFCPACTAPALHRIRRINSAAQKLASANRRHFSVSCEQGPSPTVLRIHGPTEYCEHENFFQIFSRPPAWLPKTDINIRTPLPSSVLRKSKVVDRLFHNIAEQVTLQEFLGFRYQAKTLTSNPGELELLSQLNPARGMHDRVTSGSCSDHARSAINGKCEPLESYSSEKKRDRRIHCLP